MTARRLPPFLPRRDWPPTLVGAGMGVIGTALGLATARTWPAWVAQVPNWWWIALGLLVGLPAFVVGGVLHARAEKDEGDGDDG